MTIRIGQFVRHRETGQRLQCLGSRGSSIRARRVIGDSYDTYRATGPVGLVRIKEVDYLGVKPVHPRLLRLVKRIQGR